MRDVEWVLTHAEEAARVLAEQDARLKRFAEIQRTLLLDLADCQHELDLAQRSPWRKFRDWLRG